MIIERGCDIYITTIKKALRSAGYEDRAGLSQFVILMLRPDGLGHQSPNLTIYESTIYADWR